MRAHVCMLVVLVLSLSGCGAGGIVSENASQMETWLASEIDTKYTDDFAFEFPVLNSSSQPAEFRVRSIGCSCYEIGLKDAALKVGSPFSIPAGERVVLKLRPPRPTPIDSRTFAFSLEHIHTPDSPPNIMQFTALLRVLQDLHVDSQLIIQPYTDEETTSMKARQEVTRMSRRRSDVDEAPQIEGWPENCTEAIVAPLGPAIVTDEIWKRSYRYEITVPRPDFAMGDVRRILSVRSSTPELQAQFQLVQRLASGVGGPSLIHFGETKVAVPVSRRIQLAAHDNRPFQITGIENESITIKAEHSTPQPRQWAQITWIPQSAGELKQKLRVTTDHPQKRVVEIDVRGTAAP